jgi:hypothetical protein
LNRVGCRFPECFGRACGVLQPRSILHGGFPASTPKNSESVQAAPTPGGGSGHCKTAPEAWRREAGSRASVPRVLPQFLAVAEDGQDRKSKDIFWVSRVLATQAASLSDHPQPGDNCRTRSFSRLQRAQVETVRPLCPSQNGHDPQVSPTRTARQKRNRLRGQGPGPPRQIISITPAPAAKIRRF